MFIDDCLLITYSIYSWFFSRLYYHVLVYTYLPYFLLILIYFYNATFFQLHVNWRLFDWKVFLFEQLVNLFGKDKRNTYVETTKKRDSK